MKLNGWHRLWLLGVLLLAVTIGSERAASLPARFMPNPFLQDDRQYVETAAAEAAYNDRLRRDHVANGFIVWLSGSTLLYATGYGVAWVRRGFRGE